MSSPLSPSQASQVSAPPLPPLEHAGVRYEQDLERQRRADAQRAGWLIASDAKTGARLWAAQIYANPYDAAAPVAGPLRWFRQMKIVADGARLEIEDSVGARYEVDLKTSAVTQTHDPFAGQGTRRDNRPRFD